MVLTLSSLLLQASARPTWLSRTEGGRAPPLLCTSLGSSPGWFLGGHLEHFYPRCDLVDNATNVVVSARRPAYSLESRLDHSSHGVAQGLANLLLAASHSGPTATEQ
ncbi:hypothetical protein PC116_g12125 [Phytophthora cactorum]|uniref:Uncharacterized protein n=1 Tax=Phytophthora cactorum TaxID=29920 RepID=A0A8T1DSD0_9STRA|nr:hypothetical protein PC117_g9437 [Phytophthora cactorum]KAG3023032.1 hypothetical protein PC119_g9046 [Phytophthora cactorum]KAG3173206.1 hypothetical protein C6341_g10090 [Phytophthora cactorum]KAG4239882.1 hypothetical protein PC116_g12125 [Phytophthora cactorum]